MTEHNQIHEHEERATISGADPSKSKRDLFLPVSIIAAAVMIGGAILFATLYKSGPAPVNNETTGIATTTTNTQALSLGSRDTVLGNANAKVTLIEYGDYQCPFCVAFFTQTESQIIQNYVNTGKVKMVFRNYAFLGPESVAAANAAECATDQNKLWAYHDALYTAKAGDEAGGGAENDGFYNRALFLKLAQQTGLDMPTFTSCLDGNKDASIAAQQKTDGSSAGVNSTPSFFINGTPITGAEPYSVFQSALDAALRG